MDDICGIVIHFDYGGYYSEEGDEVYRKDRHISSFVMRETLEDVTYSRLVDRIRRKIMVDEAETKLLLSYYPLILGPKRPSYILGDEDVLEYLMGVNKDQCRSLFHAELTDIDLENHSEEQFSRTEELQEDVRVNDDDGVNVVEELAVVPRFSNGENDHDPCDDLDKRDDSYFGYVDVTSDAPTNEVVPVEWEDGMKLILGQQFRSKSEVQELVARAVHKECFKVLVAKSKPDVYAVKCRAIECKWYLRVSKLKNSSFLEVRVYRKMHTCSRLTTATMKNKKRGTPSLVASVVQEDYPGQFNTPNLKTLMDLVQRRIGVKVSYSTAWRGRMQAASDVRGNPEESFNRLPSYLYMLERMNHYTVTRVEVDGKNQFKYLFFALGACIEGFRAMRQVIVVDGTHLKTKYKGVLIVAAAQDPDRHHYPLAFGVVDGEKNDSWSWFLNMLQTQIPDDERLVFVSDRNQSIIKTVGEVYPKAKHGYCIYHLSRNVKGQVFGVRKDECAKKFRECAQVYSQTEFKILYANFRERYPSAGTYLDGSLDESKWARCYFPGERYNIDTTNCVESINGVFVEARMLSLLPMIDVILAKIMEWFNKYRKISAEVPMTQILVPRVHGEIHIFIPQAMLLTVYELNSFLFEYNVIGSDGKGYLVDLKRKTCSCRYFDIDKYPCVHGVAAIIRHAESSGEEAKIEDFCSKYYWMEQWALAYSRTIYLVPHHSTWEVPDEILTQCVLPPHIKEKKGRNKVTRIPSAGESRRKKRNPLPFERFFLMITLKVDL